MVILKEKMMVREWEFPSQGVGDRAVFIKDQVEGVSMGVGGEAS